MKAVPSQSLIIKSLLAYVTLLCIKVNNHTYCFFEQLIYKVSYQFKLPLSWIINIFSMYNLARMGKNGAEFSQGLSEPLRGQDSWIPHILNLYSWKRGDMWKTRKRGHSTIFYHAVLEGFSGTQNTDMTCCRNTIWNLEIFLS